MTLYAFVAPIVPGKLEDWKAFTRQLQGEKKNDHVASRRRVGISRETVFHQKTPMGDVVVVVLEAQGDPAAAPGKTFASKGPFDRWFAERVQDIHGLSPDQMAHVPPNLQYYDWRG